MSGPSLSGRFGFSRLSLPPRFPPPLPLRAFGKDLAWHCAINTPSQTKSSQSRPLFLRPSAGELSIHVRGQYLNQRSPLSLLLGPLLSNSSFPSHSPASQNAAFPTLIKSLPFTTLSPLLLHLGLPSSRPLGP